MLVDVKFEFVRVILMVAHYYEFKSSRLQFLSTAALQIISDLFCGPKDYTVSAACLCCGRIYYNNNDTV